MRYSITESAADITIASWRGNCAAAGISLTMTAYQNPVALLPGAGTFYV